MRLLLAGIIPAVMLSGCAADHQERRAAARGALIGAAAGAVLSAATGGDALTGAAAGAAGGAAIGVITKDGRRRDMYRHRDGRRYWVDDRGRERFLDDRGR